MASAHRLLFLLGVCASFLPTTVAKDGFVFLGATGDNALRPAGVWSGLFEAFVGGVFDAKTTGIHVAMNTPHTVDELHQKVIESLSPLYAELKKNAGWKCQASDGDCSPQRLLQDVQVNIWDTRDANDQAVNMTKSLSAYKKITMYLSLPPFVFGSWSEAAANNWGKDRVHVAAEKPFGTSLEDSDKLHRDIVGTVLPEDHLHLVDHWLSFFENKHLPEFRQIAQDQLGLTEWSKASFAKVVVTEFEVRGLEGRGGFFDKVGQVRDMVQSHLLQVLALTLMDPTEASHSRSAAKLAILNATVVKSCSSGQYEGFLLEKKLTYHPDFADTTWTEVHLDVGLEAWKNVEVIIRTAKATGAELYTIELFQNSGPGVLTFEIGKEETGKGGVKVHKWPLKKAQGFFSPYPGFDDTKMFVYKPDVTSSGEGYLIQFDSEDMYFPKPYAMMAAALLTGDYGSAFVTYPECRRSWEVVTASSTAECLDPKPEKVFIYDPPAQCHNTPPNVCWEHYLFRPETVRDKYEHTFKCTAAHDREYAGVALYEAKCHPKPDRAAIVV